MLGCGRFDRQVILASTVIPGSTKGNGNGIKLWQSPISNAICLIALHVHQSQVCLSAQVCSPPELCLLKSPLPMFSKELVVSVLLEGY